MKSILSWETHKTPTGTFEYVVTMSFSRATPNLSGFYMDTVELQRSPCSTRAIAKSLAQRWVRYYQANPEAAAVAAAKVFMDLQTRTTDFATLNSANTVAMNATQVAADAAGVDFDEMADRVEAAA